MGWFLSGPADQVLIVWGVFLHVFLSVFVSCVHVHHYMYIGGYLKGVGKLRVHYRVSIPELTLSVSARMLVADGGAVGFKIARMNRRVQSSSPSARRRRCQ